MVSHPGEYCWSSYACNATGQSNPLISPHPLYDALGSDAQQRQYAYRELFRMHMDHGQIHTIRETQNQELVLDWEDFKGKIKRMTTQQVRHCQPEHSGIVKKQAVYYVI